MKANPGGQIDPPSAVGREKLIETLWETIDLQSVVLTAERRIGKTTVIKVMRSAPKSGWVPVFQDLESCHSATEFAMTVYREIHEFLSTKGKFARRTKELLLIIGGAEIGGVVRIPETGPSPHWKDILTRAIEDLIHENEASGSRLLFLWDEVPFMLANIRDRESEQTAMEVLDVLRALRQTHSGLRMIITGSIGLHHVLSSLREKNYANSPTNDMAQIEVTPLSSEYAIALATKLIDGEAIQSLDKSAAAAAIAKESDGFPFYIHHIVKAIKIGGLTASPETVESVVRTQLVSSNDPWELSHFLVRIPPYYHSNKTTVLLVLDHLATHAEPVSINDAFAMLKGSIPFNDRDLLINLFELMERDHYLQRSVDGAYGFRFPLIKRWWKLKRAL
jgi:hypothetical protein